MCVLLFRKNFLEFAEFEEVSILVVDGSDGSVCTYM